MKILPALSILSLLGLAAGCSSRQPAAVPAETPAVAAASPAPAPASPAKAVSHADERFITVVLRINHNEAIIAELVAARATTREVRDLARQLAADLDDATREARALAEKKQIALPEPRSESGDLKAWNEKKPDSLDGDYLKRAQEVLSDLADHYQKAADQADDVEIAAFAKKRLPALREQHQRASRIVPVQL